MILVSPGFDPGDRFRLQTSALETLMATDQIRGLKAHGKAKKGASAESTE